MISKTFKVVFFLRGKKKLRDGTSPIDVRLYLDGARQRLGGSGLSVMEEEWDSTAGRVSGRTSEAKRINSQLARIESDLNHLFRLNEFNKNLSLDFLIGEYKGTKHCEGSFIKFYEEFLERITSEVGRVRQYASLQKFRVLKRHFDTFLRTRYKRRDILMGELSYRLLSDFENYLVTDGQCCHNTAMRQMANLKTIILRAIKVGELESNPFVDYKIRFEKVDRGFLTDEEIKTLMTRKLELKRLEFVRDIFVFSCFTGLAYIDVSHLTKENLLALNGVDYIIINRQKTNEKTSIVLFDIAKAIIKKYEGVNKNGKLFPILSNQKMNGYLKEIAALCGIQKDLTFHMARHTFATMAISKGVPMETVSKMLGHSNLSTTKIYARITNKKLEADMMALSEKLTDFSVDEITSSTQNVEEAKNSARFEDLQPKQPVKPTRPMKRTAKATAAT